MNSMASPEGAYVSLRGAVHIVARGLFVSFRDAAGWLLVRDPQAALTSYQFRPQNWTSKPSSEPVPSIKRTLEAWATESTVKPMAEAAGWKLSEYMDFLRDRDLELDDAVANASYGDMLHTDAIDQPFYYLVSTDSSLVRGRNASGFPSLYSVEPISPDAEPLPPASSTVDRVPEDLLPVVEHVRNEFWSGNFDPSNQKTFASQEAIRGWLAEHYPNVSEARRKVVEIVACPFNRDRTKLAK